MKGDEVYNAEQRIEIPRPPSFAGVGSSLARTAIKISRASSRLGGDLSERWRQARADSENQGAPSRTLSFEQVKSKLGRGASSLKGGISEKCSKAFEAYRGAKEESSRAPSFGQVSSGLASGASRLRRGVSSLGGALSSTVSQASEGVRELRRESSGVGESWRYAKDTLSFKGFVSSGPSSIFPPNSFIHLGSGNTTYKEDARAALREARSFMGEAGIQSRGAFGSLARRVSEAGRSASELSVSAWVR